jgi:hypothetical protein
MDVRNARVAFRDRTLLDVMDLSVRFLSANGAIYARVGAAVILPMIALSFWLVAWLGVGWGWFAVVVLSMLAHTPFTILASRLVFQEDVRVLEVLAESLRVLPKLLAVRAVQVLVVVIGGSLLLLPGVWGATSFLYATEALVLERAGIATSLRRASRLANARFGEALGALLLLLALHAGVTLMGDSALRALLGDLLQVRPPAPFWEVGGGALALVAFWLFVPFYASARFLSYLDLRARLEGWDIQTRFAAVAARSTETQVQT